MSEMPARKKGPPPGPAGTPQRIINHEMITLARESRGLSQAELAELLGVTQGKVSKYESGMLAVSDADLEKLSSVLEYPPEFFFETESIYGFGTSCLHHRKRQSLPVKELRIIHALINVARIHFAHLLAGADVETNNGFFRMDIDEYESPENVARLLRASWKLPLGPIKNLVNTIENAGGIVFQFPFETDKIDAVSQWPRRTPPLFFINRDIPVDRWRYSLAHELGHIIMHAVPPPEAEEQADRFATEFLMPEREIASELDGMNLALAARLKPRWRTSMQSLVRRARDLGKISESKYKLLCIEIGKLGYRKNEPVPLAPEEPTVLPDIIRVHHDEYGYDVRRMSKLANSLETHFRRLFLPDDRPQLRIAD